MKYKLKQFAATTSALALLMVSLFILTPAQPTHAATCGPTTAFKMTVKTDNPGTSNSSSFTIPTSGSGYGYTVDINGNDNWTDVNPGTSTWNETTNRTGSVTIDFGTPGTYTIAICGSFPRIYFNNGGDKDKLLTLTQWGDNVWTSMAGAFYGASNVDVTATDGPNLTNVSNMNSMFQGAVALVGNASFNSWDTSNVAVMGYIFYGASNFNQPLNDWDTGNITNMNSVFRDASSFNQDISNWDTSSATTMSSMFLNASSFNQPLGLWDVSSVTNMSNIFFGASSFNQPLSNWNTSGLTSMSSMFRGASSFNQDINTWDTGNVTNMNAMFLDATSFNQPLNNWNTGNVTNMQSMFNGATSFNQPLSAWNTSSVTNMHSMFRGASSFNQDISNWDVLSVTNMRFMFAGYNATAALPDLTITVIPMSFNQNINNWDTSSVTDVFAMFASDVNALVDYYTPQGYTNITITGDTSLKHPFNQSLADWNVANVTDMTAMLSGTSLSEANYDATLTGWSTQTLQPNVVLGAHGLNYCTAGDARQTILDQDWTIEGDSEYCTPPPVPGSSTSGLAGTGTNHTILQLLAYAMGGAGALYVAWRWIKA